MKKFRAGVLGAIATIAAAAVLVATPGVANAYTNDHVDPETSSCKNDARTVYTVNVKTNSNNVLMGYLDLRYSNTCHTAWARFRSLVITESGNTHSGQVTIVRSNGSTDTRQLRQGNSVTSWSYMLYDLDPLSSYAKVEMDSYDSDMGSWVTRTTASY